MPAPKPPQQVRAKRTREQLLAAAKRVFADRGYEGATIDDIAEAAGCSKGAYYFHFVSKDDVLLALVDDWALDTSERLVEAAGSERQPQAALRSVLDTLFAPEIASGREPRLLLEFWSQAERNPKIRRQLTKAQRSCRELLVRAFRQAQESGLIERGRSAEAAADAALALRDGLAVQASVAGPTRSAAQARAGAAIALLAGPRPLRRAG